MTVHELPPPLTLHDIFEGEYKLNPSASMRLSFREFMEQKWMQAITMYETLGWKMIPIALRAKRPLRAAPNYQSRGADGPYLNRDEAMKWASQGFNLAAVGKGPLLWCESDDPALFLEEFMRGPLMRTPRGFALPLRREGKRKIGDVTFLKRRGYDIRDGILYELVPWSITCSKDHGKAGAKHKGPREPCADGLAHDYRVRYWFTPLSSAIDMLTLKDLKKIVK